MIPLYPTFKPVEIGDREEVERFLQAYPPYSDFNFTSLYAWDTKGARMLSMLNGNLVIRFTDYATEKPFFSFLGTKNPEETAKTLIGQAVSEGLEPILKLVPHASIVNIGSSALTITEDRDNFDYLYSVPELSALAGSKYKGRRNFVNRFEKEHPNARTEIVDLSNTEAQSHIFKVIGAWKERKLSEGKEHDADHEETAIGRLIQTAAGHTLTVTALFVDDAMRGFSIDEQLPNQYCIGHFWKADNSYSGIYDALIQKKAMHFETLGCALFNYEQDLGVEGLRKSKMDYRPVDFLKKYTITV